MRPAAGLVVAQLASLLAAGAAHAAAPARSTGPVEESAAERRAVRGGAVDTLVESPELRELRRFEQEAFPREALPASRRGDDAVLPPSFAGERWGGSGDLPPELRSPEPIRTRERPGTQAPAEWLRTLKLPGLPVRWEPQVVRFLNWFKNDPRGHGIMATWLRKMGRYRPVFERVLEKHKLPKDIVFLSMIESGFEPGAVSRVGAGGLWQFMPGVARAYGLEVSHWVDARRDPERAAEAAARYLGDLHHRFGSWSLAFAAYHAGYYGVLQSITRFNSNDYWELCRHEAGLPHETTLYVPKILAAAIVGHNPEAFGFGDVASDAPFVYDTVEVPPGTTLAAVAKATGARQEVVESMNPELVRGRTPPDRGSSRVRVPIGSAALYAGIDGARGSADQVESYVLRFGESLEDVAARRGIALRDLKKLNGVRDTVEVRPGTTIVVPQRSGARPVVDDQDNTVLVAVPERTFGYEGRDRVFYRTRDGDTLEELAGVFRLSADEICQWNNLDPEANLHGNLVLQLFVRKDFDRANVTLLDPARVKVVTVGSEEFLALEAARRGKTRLHYTARSGDTLAKIARRYGLAPGDLARINKLSSTTVLDEGQRIVVYSPTPELPREVVVGRTGPHRRPATTAGATKGQPARSAAKPAQKTAAAKTKPAAAKSPTKPVSKR